MMYQLLKKIKAALLLAICPLVFVACSDENDPDPEPGPPTCMDTLTAGWSTSIVTPFTSMNDIFFIDNNNGIAVGAAMATSTDGGINWSIINNQQGYINCFITPNGNIFGARSPVSILQTSLTNPAFTIGTFSAIDIYFTDNNNGFALVEGNTHRRMHITTNGGATWQMVDHRMPVVNSNYSYGTLHFANPSKGWIGLGKLLYHINNNIFTDSVQLNIADQASTSNYITAVQSLSSSVVFVAASNSEIFKSTNGGQSFTKISQLKQSLGNTDIHFFTEQLGYASFHNSIYKTTDGGINWQTVVTACNADFVELHFTDQGHGWACTFGGRIYRFVQ